MLDRRECRECGCGFDLKHNKPGPIYLCPECGESREVPVYYAEQAGLTKEDETGVIFTVGVRQWGERTELKPASNKIRREIAKEIRRERKDIYGEEDCSK